MEKWADYLISAVRYDREHKILQVKQHVDESGDISDSQIVQRAVIASNIKNGKTYMTVYSGAKNSWRLGKKIYTFRVGGEYCIRIDQNKVDSDNLGEIVEIEE